MTELWQDPTRTPRERAEALLPKLSVADKVGLMFQPTIDVGQDGELVEDHLMMSPVPTSEFVGRMRVTHFNVHGLPGPRLMARWVNKLQELALAQEVPIPVTLSTDPRHGFTENQGVSFFADSMSQWPEPMGFAAIDDTDLVRRFGDHARAEYIAMGIRAALHPQIDLVTEPRWGRQAQCIGQDPQRVSDMVRAYLAGFQGEELGPESVACCTKHFPGGGPQMDGEDAHFVYGQEQVYPGGRFEDHLEPFRAAIDAGTAGIMPYYGRPVDLERKGEAIESVGFGFSKQMITELLRGELGYDGVVTTDWGLITEDEVMGKHFPARAWGMEHASEEERMLKVLDAGCDQFGGESRTDLLLSLVEQGKVGESRLDESVLRLLEVKFRLGLFDNPFVDEDAAEAIVGNAEAMALGRLAQAQSITVVKNRDVLPLAADAKVWVEGMRPENCAAITLADAPEAADVAIVRVNAPFTERDHYFLESFFHQGTLDFDDETVSHLTELAAKVPVVLVVNLERPAILTPLDESMSAIVGVFGCSDAALLDALTGAVEPLGKLPFELPRSMASIEASKSDVANDTGDPLYPVGHRVAII